MQYVKSTDGTTAEKYPYLTTDLRRENPRVSFPAQGIEAMDGETLMIYSAFQVVETPPPAYDPDTETLLVEPVPSGLLTSVPIWQQVWTVEPIPVS